MVTTYGPAAVTVTSGPAACTCPSSSSGSNSKSSGNTSAVVVPLATHGVLTCTIVASTVTAVATFT